MTFKTTAKLKALLVPTAVDKVIQIADYPYCNFFGNVKEEAQMKRIYEEADVLLMTSSLFNFLRFRKYNKILD